MSKEVSTKVITGEVRFSYAHVFEPEAMNPGDEPKYSVQLLIDKEDTDTVEKIQAAIEAAKELGKSTKFGGKIPVGLKVPLRDGDAERPDDEACAGKYFINCSSTKRPGVVDKDLNKLMDRDDFKSGDYGRASITFYAFSVSGNKGIACGLNNLQVTRKGEALAGGASAEEDFGDIL